MDSSNLQDTQTLIAKGAVAIAGWTTGTYFEDISKALFNTLANAQLNTALSNCVLVLTGIYAGMNIYTWLQIRKKKRNANTKRDSK
jgi:hypothetical protein